MKKAVILHGTDSTPEQAWFPWLKAKLEAAGYEVWVPPMPANHTPNWQTYNNFLLSGEWDFADNIVVGHSSGAIEILNLLMDARCPRIKFGLLVSPWAHGYPNGDFWEEGQFDNLFPPEGFDFELITSRADKLAIIHNANDPYCPLEQAQYLAENLGAPLTVLQTEGHLGDGLTELPAAWEIIQPML